MVTARAVRRAQRFVFTAGVDGTGAEMQPTPFGFEAGKRARVRGDPPHGPPRRRTRWPSTRAPPVGSPAPARASPMQVPCAAGLLTHPALVRAMSCVPAQPLLRRRVASSRACEVAKFAISPPPSLRKTRGVELYASVSE